MSLVVNNGAVKLIFSLRLYVFINFQQYKLVSYYIYTL